MPRSCRPATPARHSAYAARNRRDTRLVEAAESALQHQFELSSVIESHAVYRATLSATRDTQTARLILASLDRVIAARALREWHRLDWQLHRTLSEQSGNEVLAAMAERTQQEVQALCARYRLRLVYDMDAVWQLQSQHRLIVRCIEIGQAERGMQHARAHVQFEGDLLLRSLHSGLGADVHAYR